MQIKWSRRLLNISSSWSLTFISETVVKVVFNNIFVFHCRLDEITNTVANDKQIVKSFEIQSVIEITFSQPDKIHNFHVRFNTTNFLDIMITKSSFTQLLEILHSNINFSKDSNKTDSSMLESRMLECIFDFDLSACKISLVDVDITTKFEIYLNKLRLIHALKKENVLTHLSVEEITLEDFRSFTNTSSILFKIKSKHGLDLNKYFESINQQDAVMRKLENIG